MGSPRMLTMPDTHTPLLCSLVGLLALSTTSYSSASQSWRPISRSGQAAESNSQHLINRRTASYPEASGAEATVDLHNKEFCVDVSTYQPVVWQEVDAEQCSTVFVKKCKDRSEEVCADVTETRCEVFPYTECGMGMETQEYTKSVLQPKLFVEKTCTQGRKMIPHVKMLPECKNVTKQNCVSLWETDPDGQQVWAGNEACEPVTDIRMTNTFTCEVKSTTSCQSQTRPDCKKVEFQECQEVPVTNCEPKTVHKPTQEKLHRKKCLLPDEKEAEAPSDSYGQPQSPPLGTYSG